MIQIGYSRENYRKVEKIFAQKRAKAKSDAEARTNEIYEKFPDIEALDREIASTMGLVMREIAQGPDGIRERIAKVRDQNLALQEERARLLQAHGYPADYTEPHFECPLCKDEGYILQKTCTCMKRELAYAGYESSGMSGLMRTQSFETFSLDYYRDSSESYENMSKVLRRCMVYAEQFSQDIPSNLLFCGATGLGKTHLSTAIAKRVIDRGFDVVYETAQNIFADFEYERFGKSYNSDDSETSRTDRYFACDLLIIDDLGAEIANQFTVASLYNIINTRLNRGRSTIISTNLSRDELRRRYADRITSRLLGEYSPLLFVGRDVRLQSLMKK